MGGIILFGNKKSFTYRLFWITCFDFIIQIYKTHTKGFLGPHMDKKKLVKYKDKLLQSKAEILKDLKEDMPVFNDRGDLADLAGVVIQNDLRNKLSDLDLEKLGLIDRALEKIDKGTYGICEGTGKSIPEARMNALPWTPYTVEYAEQSEKQKRESLR